MKSVAVGFLGVGRITMRASNGVIILLITFEFNEIIAKIIVCSFAILTI
jgi:hypothetical protein